MNNQTPIQQDKIERCGFCGRYFQGDVYVPEATLLMKTTEELNSYTLGYCPDAYYEDPTNKPIYITKEMAMDAGMPELEGQRHPL